MSSVDGIAMAEKSLRAMLTDGLYSRAVSTMPADAKNNAEWIEIDLEDEYDISRVVLTSGENNSFFPVKFKICIGDGENWTTVVDQKSDIFAPDQNEYTFTFKATKGSKIRIEISEMREDNSGSYAVALAEIEAYQE